ncbi:VTC domain containing protein [Naviculisporaceae sp. PSN 640]
MRFGKTLRQSIYPPWKDKYIDYAKLKSILRDDRPDDEDEPWTEEDENKFCDEIFNTQLENVAQFQEEKVRELRQRVDTAFDKLKDLPPIEEGKPTSDTTTKWLRDLEGELDNITNEVKELQKYSNLNYTGFLKIVKKHDRKRGDRYKIRPIMQVSLSKRPFNSEQAYSPLLNKLSLMYFAIRQHLEGNTAAEVFPPDPDSQPETHNGERYTAHKFWVHPDNLLEVKTYILRRLPALVYSELSSKGMDDANEDPTITSLYFDNKNFQLYNEKVDREAEASSLRLRWYGQLSAKPEIFLEQKNVHENGTSDEHKFAIKEKYVKPFLDGEYKMEKSIQKMERKGQSAGDVSEFKNTADEIQEFIRANKLEPVMRANYVRTAFQKPGDDRVRIAIDTDIAFIREDTLDRSRPCRDPNEWHRLDIDNSNMTYPFKNINQSEVSRFPYAVLEIKLKEDPANGRKRPTWIQDLTGSHLVHPAPRFSKFVQGVASLFEDYVNRLPFWLSDLDIDIRKDPQVAFEEEEERRVQQAQNEQVVGSLLGTKLSSYKGARSSPVAKSYLAERIAAENATLSTPLSGRSGGPSQPTPTPGAEENTNQQQQQQQQQDSQRRDYGTLSSVFPGFSLSKYARFRRAHAEGVNGDLPAGVVEPTEWIKNSGPLQIEPKVWLANERTFLKWQHICILLGGLAVSLYTAAGRGTVAEFMGIGYILVAVFTGCWGYYTLHVRRQMIIARSGRDFDNFLGPLVVSVALMGALVVNLVLAWREALRRTGGDDPPPRRVSEGDVLGSSHRRRRSEPNLDSSAHVSSDRRRPRRSGYVDSKGKRREGSGGRPHYDTGPLTEWPPSGMSSREELTLGPAMRLIARGVPAFRGHKKAIPHASEQYYALYATAAGNRGDDTDAANLHDSMVQLMTLRLLGSGQATYPWETLEQPSYTFCFGKRPGTITLNHWVSMASAFPPTIALRDPGVMPREIELYHIFERLKSLERGLEDDDEDLMYKNLYRRLLRDPDKYLGPHRTLDKQITDLIMVLSRPDWIDFTNTRNQVATKFIFDTSEANAKTYHKFFHQLLLSVELDARINSKHHMTEAKEKLLTQIPPTIQWDLALARRWRENIRIENYGDTPDQVRLRFKLRKRQVKMLKRFTQMMKWPNLADTLDNLRYREETSSLDTISSHAMAFFTGLVLPGPTFPFLIMNSLIDLDPDRATDDLALLTHIHPNCGFQYRNSYTYWTATSIVGKVLAPTCHSVAGWVGPARPCVDLARSQIARIRSRRLPLSQPPLQQSHQRHTSSSHSAGTTGTSASNNPTPLVGVGVPGCSTMTTPDVRTMAERSDPLGPPTEVFPVQEYALVTVDPDDVDSYYDSHDLVRIEMLNLRPCADRPSTTTSTATEKSVPTWFDASLQFAIDGVSWPLRLTYDVSFVCAWPCSDGPHPLFFDYVFTRVGVDELAMSGSNLGDTITGAGGGGGGGGGKDKGKGKSKEKTHQPGPDDERVLVVDAFGVPDNEVLARAWCANWGLSAIVADIGRTCMACAIREAYAATLTVVILVDDSRDMGRED